MNKKNTKNNWMVTNKRERYLLIIMSIALLAYACFRFVISPQMLKAESLQAELGELEIQIAQAQSVIDRSEELQEEEKELRQSLADKYTVFFKELDQAGILRLVDEKIAQSNATVVSYMPQEEILTTVSDSQAEQMPLTYPLSEIADNYKEIMDEAEISEEEISDAEMAENELIPSVVVLLSYNQTTYPQLKALLQSIKDLNKAVVVQEMAISGSEGTIVGSAKLAFYKIPALEDFEETYFKEASPVAFGKPNPFE
ncbi:type II secretion system protein M [Clostridia bacterium]|nr:type II secretion system protein M [Clostridia bacterium]